MDDISFFKSNFQITKTIEDNYFQVKSLIDLKKYIAIVKEDPPSEDFLDTIKFLDHPFFNKI